MLGSSHVTIEVDLERICVHARQIAARTGVPVLAVVKADAYGLGAQRVAETIAELVAGFCVFSLEEAAEYQLTRLGKPILALGPPASLEAEAYRALGVRPAVSTVEQAAALKAARPVLCLDTGMQRFACRCEEAEAVLRAGAIDEAFTHAVRVEQARALVDALGGRGLRLHAAATALLDEPRAYLDAVRPGLALYRGALRVSTRLVEARTTRGALGYGGISTLRHGIILAGYAQGLRAGICLVNGQPRRILEVGMQSAYVEIGAGDKLGDEVILLGDDLTEDDVAQEWGTTPHEVLLRMGGMGRRTSR